MAVEIGGIMIRMMPTVLQPKLPLANGIFGVVPKYLHSQMPIVTIPIAMEQLQQVNIS